MYVQSDFTFSWATLHFAARCLRRKDDCCFGSCTRTVATYRVSAQMAPCAPFPTRTVATKTRSRTAKHSNRSAQAPSKSSHTSFWTTLRSVCLLVNIYMNCWILYIVTLTMAIHCLLFTRSFPFISYFCTSMYEYIRCRILYFVSLQVRFQLLFAETSPRGSCWNPRSSREY